MAGLGVKQMDRLGIRIMVRFEISPFLRLLSRLLISQPGTFWSLFPANM
jgi:hypothetical protein